MTGCENGVQCSMLDIEDLAVLTDSKKLEVSVFSTALAKPPARCPPRVLFYILWQTLLMAFRSTSPGGLIM